MVNMNIEEFDYYTNLFEYAINKKLCQEANSSAELDFRSLNTNNVTSKLANQQAKLEHFWSSHFGRDLVVR